MKKNTLIISAVSSVLLIVFIIILVVVFTSNKEIVYETGAPNVAVTDFTKNLGKDVIKGLFPDETTSIDTMSFDAAFESLINGKNDVVLAMKPSEEMLSYSQSVMAEVEVIPIAKDALIVMNNRYNPVKNITYEQFRKIYSGEIRNWQDLGGNDLEILPYLGTQSYDSYFALSEIMNGATLVVPKLTLKNPSFENIVTAIGTYEDTADLAIGYGMFYDIDALFGNKNIQILSVNGVSPTIEAVKSGEYPLGVNVYAIIRKDSTENSRARRLVNFILSEEGQNIIEKDGYLKIEN